MERAEHVIYEVIDVLRQVSLDFNYEGIHMPIKASAEIFAKNIASSEIVCNKQMFYLSNNDNIVLRPEGTALCLNILSTCDFYKNKKRVFYHGPFFRHERKQYARFDEFYQFGIENLYMRPHIQEQEIFSLCDAAFQKFGIKHKVKLFINNIGKASERSRYIENFLVPFLKKCSLNNEQLRTLQRNPLRLLDSKDPALIAQLKDAPKISSHVSRCPSYDKIISFMQRKKIDFCEDDMLVRGLDYYDKIVFEYKDHKDISVCGGGRYDVMLDKGYSAIGCAFGVDRVAMLLEERKHTFCLYIFCKEENTYESTMSVRSYMRKKGYTVFISPDINSSVNYHIKKARKRHCKIMAYMEDNESLYVRDLTSPKGFFVKSSLETLQSMMSICSSML